MKKTNESRLALVTGASSGIGYELACQFAKNGFDLLIVSESEAIMKAKELLQKFGTQVEAIRCDLTDHDEVEHLARTITENERGLDAVAINAGVGVGGKFFETDLEEELNLIDLNVISTVHLAKRVIQDMLNRGKAGRILFTSSIASTMPGPYEAVYAASKAFIQSFALAMRYELKEKGISVTALMPGPTDTNFFHRAGMDDTKVGAGKKDKPEDVAQQGYDALMAGDESVIAGSLKTRIGNAANDLIPEQVKAGMHAKMAKPGSAAG